MYSIPAAYVVILMLVGALSLACHITSSTVRLKFSGQTCHSLAFNGQVSLILYFDQAHTIQHRSDLCLRCILLDG